MDEYEEMNYESVISGTWLLQIWMLLDHFFDELFLNAISILTVVKIVVVGNTL